MTGNSPKATIISRAKWFADFFCLFFLVLFVVSVRNQTVIKAENELARLECSEKAAEISLLLFEWQERQYNGLSAIAASNYFNQPLIAREKIEQTFSEIKSWQGALVADSDGMPVLSVGFAADQAEGLLGFSPAQREQGATTQLIAAPERSVMLGLPLDVQGVSVGGVYAVVGEAELSAILKSTARDMDITLVDATNTVLASTSKQSVFGDDYFRQYKADASPLGGGFYEILEQGKELAVYRKNTGGVFGWLIMAEKQLSSPLFFIVGAYFSALAFAIALFCSVFLRRVLAGEIELSLTEGIENKKTARALLKERMIAILQLDEELK